MRASRSEDRASPAALLCPYRARNCRESTNLEPRGISLPQLSPGCDGMIGAVQMESSATNHVDWFCYDAAGNLLNPGPCAPQGSKNPYFYDGYGTLLVGNYN